MDMDMNGIGSFESAFGSPNSTRGSGSTETNSFRGGVLEDNHNNTDTHDEDCMSTSSEYNDEYLSPTQTTGNDIAGDERIVGIEECSQTRVEMVTDPTVGLEFKDEEEAYDYYNLYAKEKGFSVRKGRVERSRIDKHILSRSFVCSNEGSKKTKDKRRNGIDYKPRATKKTNCGAAMRIKLVNGMWVVDIVVLEHNHQLVNPLESYRLRSHQKAAKGTVQLIERLHRCGVTPAQIFTVLSDFSGGEQHTGFSDVRFRSLMRAKRRKSLGVDCQLAVNYLDRMRATDPHFFYTINVNADQELTGIYWVDGRAREQYRRFGDVVVFDTTYRKNKYKFPFAPFTGVNHHMQCILFGCGLIADETKESFEWLFRTWLHSMHNVYPKSILTDEDPGIMRAIKTVFPSSVHRLCSWHLEKHRMNHLGPLYRKFPDFRHKFYTCVNRSITPLDFERSWGELMQMYQLENHKWLKKKFNIRKHWVPCYFPDTFFAGMTTTQRAESMNNFFKGYFSSSTPINEFITQYEEAVRKRRGVESKADVRCITTMSSCSTSHPLEKQAADVYTTNVFNIFKKEWTVCLGVEITECTIDLPLKRYTTTYVDLAGRPEVQIVVDNEDSDITTCTCKMFEHAGLLCKHILKVYVITDRRHIPDRYILQRWTKSSSYCRVDPISNEFESDIQPQLPLWQLHDIAHRLVTEGTLSKERYGVAYLGLTKTLEDVLKMNVPHTQDNCEPTINSAEMNMTGGVPRAIDPRNQSITRGRPIQSRITSTLENLHNKRSYHCSSCGQTGHNVVKCPKVNTLNVDGNNAVSKQRVGIDLNDSPLQEENV